MEKQSQYYFNYPISINGVLCEQRQPKSTFQRMVTAYKKWLEDYRAAEAILNRQSFLEKRIANDDYLY